MNEPTEAPTDQPSDNTTLLEVLDGYRRSGARGDLFPEEGGRVRCGTCQSVVAATALRMDSMRRLEGASDPADMLAVVATACPVCGTPGTMVLGFGAAASAEDSEVFSALQDRRDDGSLPPSSPPSETPGRER